MDSQTNEITSKGNVVQSSVKRSRFVLWNCGLLGDSSPQTIKHNGVHSVIASGTSWTQRTSKFVPLSVAAKRQAF